MPSYTHMHACLFLQVKLQVVAIDDLFVMAPLSQYGLYNMGRSVYSNVKVAASQTNEDAKEADCQTDDVSGITVQADP